MVELENILAKAKSFPDNKPFPHVVVDNFFTTEVAIELASEFPDFQSDAWFVYSNAIEEKKALNNWNVFPKSTYRAFSYLNSDEFTKFLSVNLYGNNILYSDPGLHGGGWHIHKQGGKLNTHLDYSLHPKLGKQRRVNIIVYLNPNWDDSWGGHLGLWGNEDATRPGELEKSIAPMFNRAVIFDTTLNSWHGLPNPIQCPDDEYRKSLAVYYLCDAVAQVDERGRALFAPSDEQLHDDEVLELIKDRSDVKKSSKVYRDHD